MTNFNQDFPEFGNAKPADTDGLQHCAQCEAMLADALDGTLSAAKQEQFDLHLAGCAACSQMLMDAQRGAAWLELLRTPAPEPSAALLERILAHTTSQNSIPESDNALLPAGKGLPPLRTAVILPFRNRLAAWSPLRSSETSLQPRLAMTAAMAFFSIGLTLNLAGVRLNQLRASALSPSSVRRSFYQADAHVVRYVDNMRVVYELESRVRDLQRVSDNDAPLAPQPSGQEPPEDLKPGSGNRAPQKKQSPPRPGSGSSQRQEPADPRNSGTFHLVGSPSISPLQKGELL